MKVTLMPNLTREHAFDITVRLCEALDELKIEYDLFSDSPDFGRYFPSIKNSIDETTDLLIAIGGDGTVIRAAKSALPFDIPILGVNAGKLGFLTGLENDEMFLLKNLLNGNYFVEERLVLGIKIYNAKNELIKEDFCINDAVFARGAEIRLASFDSYCDNKFINRYSSDGLIVATATGSTAYNLSAGGPIVDPRVEGIIMTPICPHSLEERAVLFSSNSVIKIGNPSENVLLSCDGNASINFKKGYSAILHKIDKKIRFVRLKDETFMDILNKKMKTK